ncbi:hypothetical protein G9A89_012358 [Geosiphon pyriformis]|nr:hypothetical protein G9A89_012358 [Geosiphon pyriformis]
MTSLQSSANSNRTKLVDSLNTNILSLAGITSIGWRKYTYTCSSEQLRTFASSVSQLKRRFEAYNYTQRNSDTLSLIQDPIIMNQIRLLNRRIPCVWRYADNSTTTTTQETSKNFAPNKVRSKSQLELIFSQSNEGIETEITRELWLFWLNHEEKPENIDNLEGLEDSSLGDCSFSWQQLDSPPLEYELFIKAFRNLIGRSMINQGGIPLGDWYSFPTLSTKVVDDGILSCKFDLHLSSTNLIFQPVVKYRKIRLLQDSDLKAPSSSRVLLAPSGLEAELLPDNHISHENAAAIFAEFYEFFKFDILNSIEAMDPSLPGLVKVRLTDGTFQREVPYPARYIYVIVGSPATHNEGIIPGIGKRITALDKMSGQPGNWLLSSIERNTLPENDIEWWNFSNYIKSVDSRNQSQQHLHRNSKENNMISSHTLYSSVPETTMTPNTPGLANDSSNSPGKPQTPQMKTSTTSQPAAHDTYPSPPDGLNSSTREYTSFISPDIIPTVTEDVLGSLPEPALFIPNYETYYDDVDKKITEDDFDKDFTDQDFDFFASNHEAPPPTSVNHSTPTPELPGSVRAEDLSNETPGGHQCLTPLNCPHSTPDLSYIVQPTKNPLVPPRWAPLIFPHIDESKYINPQIPYHHSLNAYSMSSIQISIPSSNSSKRKHSDVYQPDYRPAFLPKRKKAKTEKKNKTIETENSDTEQENQMDEEIDSDFSNDREESDSSSSYLSLSEFEEEIDNESDTSEFNQDDYEDENIDRFMDYINCARFFMLWDNFDKIRDKKFTPLVQITPNEPLAKKAAYILRDHIVFGSYPFAGEHLEGGETTRKIKERQSRLKEAFDDELPTFAAYPSEVKSIIQRLKLVLNDIPNSFPKSGDNLQLCVKGPLKMIEYCTLNEQHRYSNTKFSVKTKQPEPNYQILPSPNLVVGFKGQYHMEVSTDQLRFWERHKLEPPEGKKKISYFALYPECEQLRPRVSSFFKNISRTYKSCELGTHCSEKMKKIEDGLIPVKLLPAIHNKSDTRRALESYEFLCDELGLKLSEILRAKKKNKELNHILIYMISPFTHPTAYFDLCKLFAKLQSHLKEHLKKFPGDVQLSEYVVLQIVPIDHVIKFSTNGGTHKKGLMDIAFSVYTRAALPNEYVPPYLLPYPAPVNINFQLSEKLPSREELVETGISLHIAYGYTPDRRWLTSVFTDNVGNVLLTSTLPLRVNNIVVNLRKKLVPLRPLFEEVWKRARELKEGLDGCLQIVICKFGEMKIEERTTWLNITEAMAPIISVGMNPSFCPVDVSHEDTAKVYGMVLNHPIPHKGFRPAASGYLLEVASDRGPLSTLEVHLLHRPNSTDKGAFLMLWEILRELHALSRLDTTPIKNNCLPIHLLLVERLTRGMLGIAM